MSVCFGLLGYAYRGVCPESFSSKYYMADKYHR